MGVRKRKAADDDHSDWSPTVPVPGSSSNPHVVEAPAKPPTAKRQKKNAEKRGAIFKRKCPKAILERVARVMSQRFFMIDRRRAGEALREEFSVLGSTGNVYTVVIGKKPSCSCPDAQKGNHCKHILFIFLKVLQVTQASGHWYQKALLTSELEDIFAHAPPAPTATANARIREAYARATGKALPTPPAPAAAAAAAAEKKRIPGPEDDCPVCYENMHGAAQGTLAFCETCGNGLHRECFQQWARAARGGVTCVFCRARWVEPAAAAASGSASGGVGRSEGYLNLGSVAGVSPVRDTSSYYHGPRRGKRYYGY
ncbi:hypothetical protein SCP_1900440 [Sparassis crispa]|uniref:SWIM-type domain-containing protein n=1 Tax=Sparassis crispa TaxID=139825 RepID=A0A401H6Y5_9APHY|nr:hypothetical protein SCP_1900440 [Sparassis crispa]GBE90195.1 hypothetical protein SCP_1900440 [Sparassis crispa]